MNVRIAMALTAVLAATNAADTYAESFSLQHETVRQIFQSPEEPTAKDAVWTANNIFKVGVFDTGANRNGYAEYVCQVLYEHGFKGQEVWVQVIDFGKLNRDGKWVRLGDAHCQ